MRGCGSQSVGLWESGCGAVGVRVLGCGLESGCGAVGVSVWCAGLEDWQCGLWDCSSQREEREDKTVLA